MLYISPGTYTAASPIVTNSNIHIFGAGQGVTVITGTDDDHILIKTTKSGTSKTVYANISIRDLTISSKRGYCMRIDNTTNLLIDNCEFTFSATPNIRESMMVEHCQYVFVRSNYLHNLAGDGIQINGTNYFVVEGNNILGSGQSDDAIDIDKDFVDTALIQSKWGTVVGNTINNVPDGNGIRIGSCAHIVVADNVIDNVLSDGTCGILVNSYDTDIGDPGVQNIRVVGNILTNCLTNGIAIIGDNIVNVSVTDNNLYACGQAGGTNVRSGIQLAATGVLCADNSLDTCGKTGGDGGAIVIFKKNSQVIRGNTVTNSPTGISAWNGDALQSYTGMIVANNQLTGNTTPADLSAVSAGSIKNNAGFNPDMLYAQGNVTGATTFNRINGETITFTLTGNVTTTVTNGKAKADRLVLVGTQDATGSRTISKPSNVKLLGGAFSPTATANAVDSWTLVWDGTNWHEVSRALNQS